MKADHSAAARGRRDLLAGGMRLAILAVATTVLPHRAAAMDKLAKSAVQYDESTPMPGRDCDDCAHFVPGPEPSARGTCRVVAGDMSPHGHCVAFTPRPKG